MIGGITKKEGELMNDRKSEGIEDDREIVERVNEHGEIVDRSITT
jgi:hypothetical protein